MLGSSAEDAPSPAPPDRKSIGLSANQQQRHNDEHYFSSTRALPPSSPTPTRADTASTVATMTTDANTSAGVGSVSTASSRGGGIVANGTSHAAANAIPGPNQQADQADHQRATHTIRLAALRHNYAIVEDAASRQRCSVIVVVKADGYGHGAVDTAIHLADYCGADAFAVATLEEGVVLRKALSLPPAGGSNVGAGAGAGGPGGAAAAKNGGPNAVVGARVEFGMMPAGAGSQPPSRRTSDLIAPVHAPAAAGTVTAAAPLGPGLFRPPSPSSSSSPLQRLQSSSSAESISSFAATTATAAAANAAAALPPRNRSPRIRILVLGPPVGYPRSFDLYLHHSIELMVSGPEVARALMDWVGDAEGRRRTEVERAAAEYMKEALTRHVGMVRVGLKGVGKGALEDDDDDEDGENNEKEEKTTSPCAVDEDENDIGTTSEGDKKKENPGRVADDEKKDDTPPISPSAVPVRSSKPPRPRPAAAAGAEGKVVINAAGGAEKKLPARKASQLSETVGASATLSNVTGDDLAREVRAILLNQQAVAAHVQKQKQEPAQKKQQQQQQQSGQATPTTCNRQDSGDNGSQSSTEAGGSNTPAVAPGVTPSGPQQQQALAAAAAQPAGTVNMGHVPSTDVPATATAGVVKGAPAANAPRPGAAPFRGIEDAAKLSRDRQLAAQARREAEEEARAAEKAAEDDGGDDVIVQPNALGARQVGVGAGANKATPLVAQGQQPPTQQRKKLRWHALVDSGMGRLGFKPDPPGKGDNIADSSVIKPRKPRYSETIALIKEMHDAEVRDNAPLEFYGMCTHMADATASSTYTHSQMERFMTLLNNVRAAGIPVPTVSTDNSSALLTTSLNHFDAASILSQPGADTRGFVRTGGAIYGQRPTFPQLRAISTLTASVRHVSVIKEGDSVGYDRAYTATMDVRIATLTIGFADGYPRDLGNGVGRVSIRGSTFPVAGNVCMDMMMVELGPAGDTTGAGASVAVGDVAVLWGPEGPEDESDGLVRLQDIAGKLKTTQSALTCGLNKVRVERKYIV